MARPVRHDGQRRSGNRRDTAESPAVDDDSADAAIGNCTGSGNTQAYLQRPGKTRRKRRFQGHSELHPGPGHSATATTSDAAAVADRADEAARRATDGAAQGTTCRSIAPA